MRRKATSTTSRTAGASRRRPCSAARWSPSRTPGTSSGPSSVPSTASPSASAAAPAGHTATLSWTASSPQNGNGYAVSGVNIGTDGSVACPATLGSYAFVGGTAGTSFTDSTALAGGTDGTYVCYLVRSG